MTKKTLGVALVALLLTATIGLASDSVLRANLDEAGIGFDADTSHRGISVRITGQGQVVERSFTADDEAYVSHGAFGLPDGQYRYEAVLTPSTENLVRRASRIAGVESAPDMSENIISGSFRIENGAIVLDGGQMEPGAEIVSRETARPNPEGLVSAVQEQSIQDSLCVGLDCVTNESFGFDTLRLKENNLRIRFFDTSSSGSFPSNDWQLVANDSNNGGANRFSIEDIDGGRTPFTIEAGAPNNALYVDNGGLMGFGTNAPVVEMHVKDGDTPTMRLEQDGSSGFASQIWDVAGNETNFFVRDVSNGSKLPFKVFPNAPTNSLTVEGSTGDIGVGTPSPQAKLDVRGEMLAQVTAGAFSNLLTLQNDNAVSFRIHNTSHNSIDMTQAGNGNYRINFDDGDGQELELDEAGNLTISGQLVTGSNTYPDYVFDEGYDLLSLDEVKAFIEANGHLPRVPSEAEVEELGGVNISALSVKLLEKVEELTLYTLQQEERIRSLEAALEKAEQ